MNTSWMHGRRWMVLVAALAISGGATCAATEAPKADAPDQGRAGQPALPKPPVKTIGIIGGVSWVSSIEYYRLMNEMFRDQLGGLHSAQILMFSIEFADFAQQERLADQGDWVPLTATMIDAAQRLKQGGAEFIVIASNTLNSQAGIIETTVGIPVLHIADATADAVLERGEHTVALLGTKYTMEQPFYRERLEKRGLKVVTPNARERDYINTVIFDELCRGRIEPESRKHFVQIINRLVKEEGAEGVILGCTEIPLLVKSPDVGIPVFDTTAIHAAAAVKRSLNPK